jgi:hypothetical protein
LVLIRGPHILDDLFSLCFRDPTVFGQDLSQHRVDFARHVGSVTTNVEIRLLLQEFVDLPTSLLETVLDVNLLCAFS